MHTIIQLLFFLLFYGIVEWRQESMGERGNVREMGSRQHKKEQQLLKALKSAEPLHHHTTALTSVY